MGEKEVDKMKVNDRTYNVKSVDGKQELSISNYWIEDIEDISKMPRRCVPEIWTKSPDSQFPPFEKGGSGGIYPRIKGFPAAALEIWQKNFISK